ncbi:hypothetical protein EDB84DRAFT_1579715 [Lactarius hengduanensis]|nr:hypothetical protein EDB84DRAFT_1579715 [Lactarius hengduanensis]
MGIRVLELGGCAGRGSRDSFVFNRSFTPSVTSIASYKTERTVNSRKSRYNILPRREYAQYADIGPSSLPQGPVSLDVDDDDALVLQTELDDRPLSSPLRIPVRPISRNANFVEASGPSLAQLEHLRSHSPLDVRGNTIGDFSIKHTGSQLERTINRWASSVLRITPAPAATLQEAVLTDLTAVGESAALLTDVRPMMVQSLLRHAMAEVISDGIINSLVVTNSADANLECTSVSSPVCFLPILWNAGRDATAAAVWRRLTFSVAVEHLTPEMMRTIFEESMPSLAALLPDSAEDTLGRLGVRQEAFHFSRMLHGAPASAVPGADALYRPFVPELASTSDSYQYVLFVKPCRRYDRREGCLVGTTVVPGLVKVFPPGPGATPGANTQTVVRRAQVICKCALLATNHPVSAPPTPTM